MCKDRERDRERERKRERQREREKEREQERKKKREKERERERTKASSMPLEKTTHDLQVLVFTVLLGRRCVCVHERRQSQTEPCRQIHH